MLASLRCWTRFNVTKRPSGRQKVQPTCPSIVIAFPTDGRQHCYTFTDRGKRSPTSSGTADLGPVKKSQQSEPGGLLTPTGRGVAPALLNRKGFDSHQKYGSTNDGSTAAAV